MTQFQINREDQQQTQLVEVSADAYQSRLARGEALLRVEHFGFSANNVTYAVLGDQLGYWRFFPAFGDRDDTWGVVPVWGYAQVVASQAEAVAVGERLFGYFPTATHMVMRPEGRPGGVVIDAAAHREDLPAGYNAYSRVGTESDAASEHLRMLLFPLYLTSWAIGQTLSEASWYDAEQVVITSASSKTAIGLVYALQGTDGAPTAIGVTAAGNREWVEGLGLYDRVVTYDEIEEKLGTAPSIVVDLAGNGGVLGRLHAHLGEAMRRSVNVGITHWKNAGGSKDLIRERTEVFFAPSVIVQRMKAWGREEFQRQTESFIADAVSKSADWLGVDANHDLTDLERVYATVRDGQSDPGVGFVIGDVSTP